MLEDWNRPVGGRSATVRSHFLPPGDVGAPRHRPPRRVAVAGGYRRSQTGGDVQPLTRWSSDTWWPCIVGWVAGRSRRRGGRTWRCILHSSNMSSRMDAPRVHRALFGDSAGAMGATSLQATTGDSRKLCRSLRPERARPLRHNTWRGDPAPHASPTSCRGTVDAAPPTGCNLIRQISWNARARAHPARRRGIASAR